MTELLPDSGRKENDSKVLLNSFMSTSQSLLDSMKNITVSLNSKVWSGSSKHKTRIETDKYLPIVNKNDVLAFTAADVQESTLSTIDSDQVFSVRNRSGVSALSLSDEERFILRDIPYQKPHFFVANASTAQKQAFNTEILRDPQNTSAETLIDTVRTQEKSESSWFSSWMPSFSGKTTSNVTAQITVPAKPTRKRRTTTTQTKKKEQSDAESSVEEQQKDVVTILTEDISYGAQQPAKEPRAFDEILQTQTQKKLHENLPIEVQAEINSASQETAEMQTTKLSENSIDIVDIGSSTGDMFFNMLPNILFPTSASTVINQSTAVPNKAEKDVVIPPQPVWNNTSIQPERVDTAANASIDESDQDIQRLKDEDEKRFIQKSAFLYGIPITIIPAPNHSHPQQQQHPQNQERITPKYIRSDQFSVYDPSFPTAATLLVTSAMNTTTTSVDENTTTSIATCPRLLFPSQGDMHYLHHLQTQNAIESGLAIQTIEDCDEYLQCISLSELMQFVIDESNHSIQSQTQQQADTTKPKFSTTTTSSKVYSRIDAIKVFNRLFSLAKPLIDDIFASSESRPAQSGVPATLLTPFLDSLCDILLLPFQYLHPTVDKNGRRRVPKLPRLLTSLQKESSTIPSHLLPRIVPIEDFQALYDRMYSLYLTQSMLLSQNQSSDTTNRTLTDSEEDRRKTEVGNTFWTEKGLKSMAKKPKKLTRYEEYLLAQDDAYRGQHEAVSLIQRMVRHGSELTIQRLKKHTKLIEALQEVMKTRPPNTTMTTSSTAWNEHVHQNMMSTSSPPMTKKVKATTTSNTITNGSYYSSISSLFTTNFFASLYPSKTPKGGIPDDLHTIPALNPAPIHAFQTPSRLTTGPSTLVEPIQLSYEDTKQAKQFLHHASNSSTTIQYVHLQPFQMAKIALSGMGGMSWTPKQPKQRGIRILCFDGGGTRGVVSVALLKELFRDIQSLQQQDTFQASQKRASEQLKEQRRRTKTSTNAPAPSPMTTKAEAAAVLPLPLPKPCDYFDIICGTSTGGIIAMLLGAQCHSIEATEQLYDDFIDQIFKEKSNFKLVTNKAYYDEKAFEEIIYKMCGDAILLDSQHQDRSTNVFCVSTQINANPPKTFLWRNYDYPEGATSRYSGSCHATTLTAIRATSAAPTFFPPVKFNNHLFCDGALVANNPTAIAIQEAKTLYPGIPIELVVSIGTGVIKETTSTLQSMGWDLLVNQLIASSTNTEDVHSLLHDFLPTQTYFRFNPILPNNTAIDEKAKNILQGLKDYAKEYYQSLEGSEEMIDQQQRTHRKLVQGEDQTDYEEVDDDEEEEVVVGNRGRYRKGKNRLSNMVKKLYGK